MASTTVGKTRKNTGAIIDSTRRTEGNGRPPGAVAAGAAPTPAALPKNVATQGAPRPTQTPSMEGA